MGLDEALLADTGARPTLRFYSWSPDTLSLGYFQRWLDVPATEHAGAVVRRITGGGAIHHVNELTFSIIVAQDHPLYRGPVADSYERIHQRLAAVLGSLGVPAELRGERCPIGSDRKGTGMCFHESTFMDLVWANAKGVGSAQRRREGRVLHHGSIKLGTSDLEPGIATLGSAGLDISPAELADEISRALGAWEDDEPARAELDRALELGARYVDPSFLRRR